MPKACPYRHSRYVIFHCFCGVDISRIKNLLYWVHDNIEHDGSAGVPEGTVYPYADLNTIDDKWFWQGPVAD